MGHGENADQKRDGAPPSSSSGTTAASSNTSPPPTTTTIDSHQSSTVTVSDTEDSPLIATPSMCYHCFDTLIDVLQKPQQQQQHNHKRTNSATDSPDFVQTLPDKSVECPIFVTWEINKARTTTRATTTTTTTPSWQLRGCIGSLSPRLLTSSVGEYAIMSAVKDRRFRPITLSEIGSLRVSVSLLIQYEDCKDVFDWTIGIHGILIKFSVHGHHYNATYLPEVAKQQGWDHHQAVTSLIHKAGYDGVVSTDLLQSIRCTRYQSSKCQVTYDEYVQHNCAGQDPFLPPHHKARQSSSSWASPCINM
ncbi:AMMECR1 domain containing protein [Nitzschia inconspicua]|uniref:AMMECR1 domain containing protein n=1 Tax=Nitzschia inconspicua TaxID=303405 RepID=A0A9K3PBA0_9STRA|nr:AMMECR1 domain containing protein [Nitzschia inconspicua]